MAVSKTARPTHITRTNGAPTISSHNHFNYIELPTHDISAMKAFYTAAFGWEYVDYGPTYASITGAGVDGGFDADSEREPSDQGALVILYSNDLENSQKAVVTAGGEITVPIFSFPGGRRFHFKDPSGNELAVWSPAAE